MKIKYLIIFAILSIKSLKNNNYLILDFLFNDLTTSVIVYKPFFWLKHMNYSKLTILLNRYSVV